MLQFYFGIKRCETKIWLKKNDSALLSEYTFNLWLSSLENLITVSRGVSGWQIMPNKLLPTPGLKKNLSTSLISDFQGHFSKSKICSILLKIIFVRILNCECKILKRNIYQFSRFRIFFRLLVSMWREVYSFWGI